MRTNRVVEDGDSDASGKEDDDDADLGLGTDADGEDVQAAMMKMGLWDDAMGGDVAAAAAASRADSGPNTPKAPARRAHRRKKKAVGNSSKVPETSDEKDDFKARGKPPVPIINADNALTLTKTNPNAAAKSEAAEKMLKDMLDESPQFTRAYRVVALNALRDLDITDVQLNDQCGIELFRALQANTILTNLKYVTAPSLDRNAGPLMRVVGSMAGNGFTFHLNRVALTRIMHSLSRNELGDGGAQELADVLAANQTIRSLNIVDCGLSYQGIAALAKSILPQNTALTSLTLNAVTLPVQDFMRGSLDVPVIGAYEWEWKPPSTYARQKSLYWPHKNLQFPELVFVAEALRQNARGVTTVDLSGNRMSAGLAAYLAHALRKNTHVLYLRLSDNPEIGAEGASCMAMFLRRNRTLQGLRFDTHDLPVQTLFRRNCRVVELMGYGRRNPELPPEPVAQLTTWDLVYVAEAIKAKPIRRLRMEGHANQEEICELVGILLSRNRRIKRISLRHNGLTDNHVFRFVEAGYRVSSGVIALSLERNELTALGACYVAACYSPSLTMLNLSDNRIDDYSASTLAALLQVGSLRGLDLAVNSFTSAGASVIAHSLQTATQMVALSFAGNHIGDAGVIALAAAITSHPNMRTLDVSATNTTKEGGSHLQRMLKKNRIMLNIGLVGNPELAGRTPMWRVLELVHANRMFVSTIRPDDSKWVSGTRYFADGSELHATAMKQATCQGTLYVPPGAFVWAPIAMAGTVIASEVLLLAELIQLALHLSRWQDMSEDWSILLGALIGGVLLLLWLMFGLHSIWWRALRRDRCKVMLQGILRGIPSVRVALQAYNLVRYHKVEELPIDYRSDNVHESGLHHALVPFFHTVLHHAFFCAMPTILIVMAHGLRYQRSTIGDIAWLHSLVLLLVALVTSDLLSMRRRVCRVACAEWEVELKPKQDSVSWVHESLDLAVPSGAYSTQWMPLPWVPDTQPTASARSTVSSVLPTKYVPGQTCPAVALPPIPHFRWLFLLVTLYRASEIGFRVLFSMFFIAVSWRNALWWLGIAIATQYAYWGWRTAWCHPARWQQWFPQDRPKLLNDLSAEHRRDGRLAERRKIRNRQRRARCRRVLRQWQHIAFGSWFFPGFVPQEPMWLLAEFQSMARLRPHAYLIPRFLEHPANVLVVLIEGWKTDEPFLAIPSYFYIAFLLLFLLSWLVIPRTIDIETKCGRRVRFWLAHVQLLALHDRFVSQHQVRAYERLQKQLQYGGRPVKRPLTWEQSLRLPMPPVESPRPDEDPDSEDDAFKPTDVKQFGRWAVDRQQTFSIEPKRVVTQLHETSGAPAFSVLA